MRGGGRQSPITSAESGYNLVEITGAYMGGATSRGGTADQPAAT
jgi:hypothetical protein